MACLTTIDWAATGSMLQGIGTLAGVGAVLIGAKIGANTWKNQKLAERRLEMAERILTATHKGRTALGYVRSPMMWEHELSAAEEKLKEDKQWAGLTEVRQKRQTTAEAYFNRLNRTKDEQLALDECLPMARALFSEKLEKAIEKLRHQFWIVQADVKSYIDDEHGTDAEFEKKLMRGMFDIKPMNGKVNEVSATIAESVSIIETACEPALRLDPIKPPKKGDDRATR